MKKYAQIRWIFNIPLLVFALSLSVHPALTQVTAASLSILVQDPQRAVIPGAEVTISSTDTGLHLTLKTNRDGLVVFPSLQPIQYTLSIRKQGFAETVVDTFKLDVAAAKSLAVTLKVGKANEVVTVDGSAAALNTTDGTVSTVISKTLIDNMPLNGKDLQTLFELSPGTILNAGGTPNAGGGFSVDGQRPTANYLTIDGASGNAFAPPQGGANVTGATIATSASGGTNGILPIDAIEEYRMDTSTYTAENGRTPGGQIQVRTRSGNNYFHGTLFENFRNQILDATDWFVKYKGLKQAQLRMNDFGGTLGGPILRNRLFFFVAHDTLFLDQPNTVTQTFVPGQTLISSANSSFKPFLSAFPTGNGGAVPSSPAFDYFNASYPDLFRDHTTSIRIDGQLPRAIHAFFRANLAPSSASLPGIQSTTSSVNVNTYTGGVIIPMSHHLVDELTVNRTSTNNAFDYSTSSLGGNDPNAIRNNLPTGVNPSHDFFEFGILTHNIYASVGPTSQNNLTQWNILDSLSWEVRKHLIKVGTDVLTRQSTVSEETNYYFVGTGGESAAPYTSLQNGTVTYLSYSHFNAQPVISLLNTSLYVNDDWKLLSSLTVNYGLRWEYNPAPSVGPLGTLVVSGTSIAPATIAASITNNPQYQTRHDSLAPRLGFAWTVPGRKNGLVVRGGAGVYFDTGQAATQSQSARLGYPYQSSVTTTTPTAYQSIDWSGLVAKPATLPLSTVYLVDPLLLSPRTYEWSLTVEQQLWNAARLSVSYVGNDGERLVGNDEYYNKADAAGQYPVNSNLVSHNGYLYVVTNQSHSNYQALQTQLTSRIGTTLNAIVSYTWGHAEDNGSTDFSSVGAAAMNPLANSSYDFRHIFASAIHYAPTGVSNDRVLKSLTSGWELDTIARLQTAAPISVTINNTNPSAFLANADVVANQPAILHQKYTSSGALVPGGKMLNFNAFAAPPTDSTGNPLRQGNSPTNGYRLFGLTQWDLAASRTWKIWESVNLKFRVDAFNILNMPNFASVSTYWYPQGASAFGLATNTYAGAYGASAATLGTTGAQLSSFQNGGPRQLQLSLKLAF